MGLAGALTPAGMDQTSMLWSLLGFNLGIEFAQLGVALLAATLWCALQALPWLSAREFAPRVAALSAFLVGTFWLTQRIVYF